MKKILFVSIAFPPKNDPECLQTAKYFKYLAKERDVSVSVVTSKSPTLFMPDDQKLKKYDQGYVNKIEIPIYENKYTNYLLRRFLPGGIDRPDSKYSFYLQWKKVASHIRHKPDLVYSRSFPLSSAIMALKLKKFFKIPWIMHLSDPWADSPLHHFTKSQHVYHNNLEKECFDIADKITFTSKKTIEFYLKKYPHYYNKFEWFPNVYDKEDIVEKPFEFDEKIKFVYTGGLVGERSPKYIFEAIEKMLKLDQSVSKKISFVFAGQVDRQNKQYFEENKYNFVSHIGSLSFPDALELQRTASVLLVIDSPIEDEREAMFFPSKLLDYMIAKRRIVAITTRKSTTYDVMQNLLGVCVDHNETGKLAEIFLESIKEYERQNKSFFISTISEDQYSADFNAKRLTELINKL